MLSRVASNPIWKPSDRMHRGKKWLEAQRKIGCEYIVLALARDYEAAPTSNTAAWPCGVTLKFKKALPAGSFSPVTTESRHSGSAA